MPKLADLMETSDFRSFNSKFSPDTPWIPHNLLCTSQNLLAETASVADSTKNESMVKNDRPIESSTFDKLYMIFIGYE